MNLPDIWDVWGVQSAQVRLVPLMSHETPLSFACSRSYIYMDTHCRTLQSRRNEFPKVQFPTIQKHRSPLGTCPSPIFIQTTRCKYVARSSRATLTCLSAPHPISLRSPTARTPEPFPACHLPASWIALGGSPVPIRPASNRFCLDPGSACLLSFKQPWVSHPVHT